MNNADAPASALEQPKKDFLTVGIGASAGGIKALKEFFTAMPADSGMAFVVILHLSQEHESMLAQILQTQTKMKVAQVTETVKVEPNKVYVIPPAKHLEMIDGTIALKEPERIRGRRVPIDLFFRTLAEAHGENGIAIVLSGTGSDGTLGLKRVKENGGIGIAQEPSEAEYDGMPRSAINTGLVDLVLPVAEMPQKIIGLRRNGAKIRLPEAKDEISHPAKDKDADILNEILKIVRVATGHDFSAYKHATVLRRIARRLQVHGLTTLPEYLAFLRENPEEAEILQRDFLITVTNFFRDKEAFAVLESEVVPKLFAGKTAADTIRVWSVGTATGEEAYSLAILLDEYASHITNAPTILIFASDINEQAIAKARDCHYEETIVADVSPERLRRYFVKENGGYRVRREIREQMVFAPHNILRDPPFSKLDLIVCRNLLIYFNRETQGKVLGIFNFALRRDGFLFLGASETAEHESALFSVTDKKQRIYKARPAARHQILPALPAPDKWNVKVPKLPIRSGDGQSISSGEIHYKLVEQFAPPSVLVNDEYEIIHVSENAGRFLRVAGGEPSHDLLKLVHPTLKLDLQSALFEAKNDGFTGESPNVRFVDGTEMFLDITVRRVQTADTTDNFYLVLFDEAKTADASAPKNQTSRTKDGRAQTAGMIQGLEVELQTNKNRLRATIEQNETSTEELRASNEEMQAMNEELRSALEELETSKEELQSVNEELITVNHELKDKVVEVTRSNSDLQNLMFSTDIGTIFLDRALRIKRYTPRAADIFNIIPSDVGRPFEHLTHCLDYDDLTKDAERVLEKLKPIERETTAHLRDEGGGIRDEKNTAQDGFVHPSSFSPHPSSYIVRLLPYRTLDDRIDGVVLTFVDVSELRRSEKDLRQSEERFSAIVRQTTAGMAQTDLDGKLLLVNDRFCEITGYECDELLEMRIHDLTHEEDLPQGAKLFDQTAAEGKPFIVEKRYVRKDGAIVWIHCTVSAILGADGKPQSILAVALDISERKSLERQIVGQSEILEAVVVGKPLDEILHLSTRIIERQLPGSLCSVLLANADATQLFDGAAQSLPDEYNAAIEGIAIGESVGSCGTAAFRRKPVFVADTLTDPIWADFRELAVQFDLRACWSHPIVSPSGKLLGTFAVYFHEPRSASAEEIKILESAARFAGIAVERKLAETELGKWEYIFNHAGWAVASVNPEDNTFVLVNPAFAQMHGYAVEELLGQPLAMTFAPETRAELPAHVAAAHEQGDYIYESLHVRQDGTTFPVLTHATTFKDENGRVLYRSATFQDITERKLTEKALQDSEKALREADKRKDEFLAMLAHELRNPLAPIRSGLEIIRRADCDEAMIEQTLNTVERQTNQIVHLVDDLLDISRITQGKIKLKKMRMELQTAVEMALETNRELIALNGHDLTVSLPDAPVFLDADLTRIAQIILNLLNNSAKYTEPGGKIWLTAETNADEVEIRVRDTGIGIPPEMLAGIFEMFTQIETTAEQTRAGLGIGLSVVKSLVEMHDGTITALSAGKGKGSEFVVRLPLSKDEGGRMRDEEESTKDEINSSNSSLIPHPSSLKILVVDDNADALEMMKVLLTLDNHTVRTAFDGETAIKIAPEFQPKVCILDIGLPIMNGYELARRLREQMPQVLLIALSGWGQDEDRRRSSEAGFNYHLVKPIEIEVLENLLAEIK